MKDDFFKNLLITLGFIGTIVLLIVIRVKGLVDIHIGYYVSISIAICLFNFVTYLPLLTIVFIVLKLMGRLLFGWGWIIVAIILDIIAIACAAEVRNSL